MGEWEVDIPSWILDKIFSIELIIQDESRTNWLEESIKLKSWSKYSLEKAKQFHKYSILLILISLVTKAELWIFNLKSSRDTLSFK